MNYYMNLTDEQCFDIMNNSPGTMSGEAQAELVSRGYVFEHDGDVHTPTACERIRAARARWNARKS